MLKFCLRFAILRKNFKIIIEKKRFKRNNTNPKKC